jgi:hypothetical protein
MDVDGGADEHGKEAEAGMERRGGVEHELLERMTTVGSYGVLGERRASKQEEEWRRR